MFKGFDTYKETVCKRSYYKKTSTPGVCNEQECKHHAIHVKSSQSGIEYHSKDMYFEDTCKLREPKKSVKED